MLAINKVTTFTPTKVKKGSKSGDVLTPYNILSVNNFDKLNLTQQHVKHQIIYHTVKADTVCVFIPLNNKKRRRSRSIVTVSGYNTTSTSLNHFC